MLQNFRRTFAVAAVTVALGAAGTPAALANTVDPTFQAVNRTGRTIQALYVSPTSTENWGRDILGEEVLPNNWNITVRPPRRECLNDIRWVLADGRSFTRMQVNTCRLATLDLR